MGKGTAMAIAVVLFHFKMYCKLFIRIYEWRVAHQDSVTRLWPVSLAYEWLQKLYYGFRDISNGLNGIPTVSSCGRLRSVRYRRAPITESTEWALLNHLIETDFINCFLLFDVFNMKYRFFKCLRSFHHFGIFGKDTEREILLTRIDLGTFGLWKLIN